MYKKDSIKEKNAFYYDILPAINIDKYLIYYSDKFIEDGSIIEISIRKKIVLGCIIKKIKEPKQNLYNIKKIHNNLAHVYFSNNIISFIEWIAKYNVIKLGAVLKLFLSNKEILKERKYSIRWYSLGLWPISNIGVD